MLTHYTPSGIPSVASHCPPNEVRTHCTPWAALCPFSPHLPSRSPVLPALQPHQPLPWTQDILLSHAGPGTCSFPLWNPPSFVFPLHLDGFSVPCLTLNNVPSVPCVSTKMSCPKEHAFQTPCPEPPTASGLAFPNLLGFLTHPIQYFPSRSSPPTCNDLCHVSFPSRL